MRIIYEPKETVFQCEKCETVFGIETKILNFTDGEWDSVFINTNETKKLLEEHDYLSKYDGRENSIPQESVINCPTCGEYMTQENIIKKNITRIAHKDNCSHCDAELGDKDKVCSQCGAPVNRKTK